ncbi:tRNA pseudouridine(38-40) synthase TruA [Jatrophihabitans fulvus]
MQGVLENALATVLRVPSAELTVAGRTDAGVHASGQVAHADLPALPTASRLNRALPDDVRVRAIEEAPPGFDARFAALSRRYEYRLCDRTPDPLRRGFVTHHPRPLDVPAMVAAAPGLLGLNDFAAFCKRRDGATTRRTLLRLDIARDADEIVVTVVADAFCHSMVRSLVGSLLAVGEGRRPSDWPASLLGLGTRANDVAVAPAHGLTLVEVTYPPDDELAARAAQTRARR